MNRNKKSADLKRATFLYEIIFKVGILFFLLGIAYNLYVLSAESKNFESIIKILIIILFASLSMLTVAMQKKYFSNFSFFLILILSFFKIITILSKDKIDIEIVSVYFLVITMSLYILTRVTGRSHRQ